jgi:hypothetical protein
MQRRDCAEEVAVLLYRLILRNMRFICASNVRQYHDPWLVFSVENSCIGCVCTSKERRKRRSGELETRYRVRHARAGSCDYDVTTGRIISAQLGDLHTPGE